MTAFAKGKKLEGKLNAPKDEIGDVIHHFEQMKEQIEVTNAALNKQQQEKEFIVASLSHDLKTPLTVIRTYSEALLRNERLTTVERKEYEGILFEKLDYMKQMLDDLSIYTALQSSKAHTEYVTVEGEEFFDMLLTGFEEPCANNNIHLTVHACVANEYTLDPKQMVRIVDNLMGNSIRYTPNNKKNLARSSSQCLPAPGLDI